MGDKATHVERVDALELRAIGAELRQREAERAMLEAQHAIVSGHVARLGLEFQAKLAEVKARYELDDGDDVAPSGEIVRRPRAIPIPARKGA
jgi:hypothetical protein